MRILKFAVLLFIGFSTCPLPAQLQISGDFMYTQKFLDKHTYVNTNFRGDDPFNAVRGRLFARNWLTDDIAIFTEFLFDISAPVRMNGAYAVFNNVVPDLVNLKIGLIPSPFGNYGLRSTYFNLNPVIGVPALWHYKTSMIKKPKIIDNQATLYDANARILDNRSAYSQFGTPIGYDACWDTGIEMNGRLHKFEYAVALTNNAMSNPTYASENDGYQYIARLGLNPVMGMRFGISGALASYIGEMEPATENVTITEDEIREQYDLDSYYQRVGGVYFEYLFRQIQFYSEWVYSGWDVPGLMEETLNAHSGYAELRWDFTPSWYVASRIDYMGFSEIEDTRAGSATLGEDIAFDVPFVRIEPGIGWRFRREGMIKCVYQLTNYTESVRDNVQILALQLHMVF
ncbi:MAG: hypothetical protein K9N46_14145 [Candidatus Marinimicrobia bacterium]|nr:hypothetical protein [Candidatus Neomarinimicrobiota bacterium]MCF7829976.1 hypothetical protein [Candidatus Neomarinimicrobiota bacterium]MCF7881870.1 hypothetical protein [Candidatus Neomarinimicrobiota bacterium]